MIAERDGVLPVEVHEDGYYYDPHDLFRALVKKRVMNLAITGRDYFSPAG